MVRIRKATHSRRNTAPPVNLTVLAQKVAARLPLGIDEWCAKQHKSRATFYNERRAGLGPRITQVVPGGRCTISADADDEYVARHSHVARAT